MEAVTSTATHAKRRLQAAKALPRAAFARVRDVFNGAVANTAAAGAEDGIEFPPTAGRDAGRLSFSKSSRERPDVYVERMPRYANRPLR